jgi:hypothetical protein
MDLFYVVHVDLFGHVHACMCIERFDAYDGEPLSQTDKKDNGVHMLARHARCHCDGRVCLETREQPKRTCQTLCNKWVTGQ